MTRQTTNTSQLLEGLREALPQAPGEGRVQALRDLLSQCAALPDGQVALDYAQQHMSGRCTHALERGRADLALEALVDAWQVTRAPDLAQAIRRLGERLEPLVPPLGDDWERDFIERCRLNRAIDTSVLLPCILRAPKSHISKRLRAFLERTPDPRARDLFLEMIATPPTTSSSNFSTWTQLFKALPDFVDQSQAHVLETRAATPGTSIGQWRPSLFWGRLNALIEKALPRLTSPIDMAFPELLEAVESAALPHSLDDLPDEHLEPVTSLKEAAELIEADPEASLDQIVRFWEAHRWPEISDVIDRLGLVVDRAQPPLRASSDKKRHLLWIERAAGARPAHLGPLLETINDGKREHAEDRMEEALSWSPDPRVATLMVALTEDYMIGGRNRFWELVYRNITHHADSRLTPWFEQEVARLSGHSYGDRRSAQQRAIRRVQGDFEASANRAAPLSVSDRGHLSLLREALDGLERAHEAQQQEEHALLRAVVEDWDEEAPRQAYVAWLKQRRDPRAEFIELDTALAAGKRVRGKRDKHLKTWRDDLLGPLRCADWVAWERGLLDEVQNVALPHTSHTAHITTDPRWRSVKTLKCSNPSLAQVLRHAPLTRLTKLDTSAQGLAGLAARTTALPVVELRLHASRQDDLSFFSALDEVLPQLRRIWFTPWTQDGQRACPPPAFFEAALLRHVTHVYNGGARTGGFPDLSLWLARHQAGGATATLVIEDPAGVLECVRVKEGYELQMTPHRALRDLTERETRRVCARIRSLPRAQVTRLTLEGAVPDEVQAALEQWSSQ